MLRWKLGDAAFFDALHNYLNDPKLAYAFARTIDLQHHFEAASGQDLAQFFKDWFKGQGYPSYHVEWTQLGSEFVRFNMKQTTSDASVSFFALPVALKFKNATQEKTVVIDNRSNNEIFIRNIGFVADTVLVDPEFWLTSRFNTSVKIPDQAAYGIKVFPNPVIDQIYISFSQLTSSSSATIVLYNSSGQRVYSSNVTLLNGSQYIAIPAQHLASGVYTIRINAGSELKYTKKLWKY
jgi:hypothetical protein